VHFLMFQMKRAHLRSVAAARPLSLRVGLTPTRYDFMQVINGFRIEPPQHLLWRALGISRTSASKMVRRLIELGLVQRRRAPKDRRTFLVSLTALGAMRLRRTVLHLLKKRPFQRRFERAFGERSWKTFRAVDRLNDTLRCVAKHLGDTSWTLYLTKLGKDPWRRRRPPDVTLAGRLRRFKRRRRRLTRSRRAPAARTRSG
jgi:DNA-binding MarR family transcriptional regulator